MNYSVPGTLDYYSHMPHLKAVDLSYLRCRDLAERCWQYWNVGSFQPIPDREAVNFYALNHLVSIIKTKFTIHEKLPAWVVNILDNYFKELHNQSTRLMYYLTLIVTRESRHNQNLSFIGFWDKKLAQYGESATAFVRGLHGGHSIDTAKKFCASSPDCSLGEYFGLIHDIFSTGKFGSQFGGKKWANVAKPLLDMIEGKSSFEILVDTGYTLAHNNGPIFNKGMLYQKHTSQFMKILDVQRGGQILEAVYSGLFLSSTDTLMSVQIMKKEFPTAFGDIVDWGVVQALGAKGNYVKTKIPHDSPTKHDSEESAALKKFAGTGKKLVGIHSLYPGKKVAQFSRTAA